MRSNVTQNVLRDAAYSTAIASGLGQVVRAARAPAPKKLNATHEAVLKRVGSGIGLGNWSKVLLYSGAVSHWKKAEHKALVQLVKRGDLEVIHVTGPDLEPWLEGMSTSDRSSTSNGSYIIVPTGSAR